MKTRLAQLFLFMLLFCLGLGPQATLAQSAYSSEPDDLVTIRKLSILPVFDNLRGIYARPVESHLIDLLKMNHRFEFAESATAGPVMTPDEIENSPELIKKLSQNISADAFLASKVTKGPGGISISMSLFLTKDHSLISKEEISGISQLDVESVQKASEELFARVMRKIPYDGVILSRQGNRVTLSLGARDGVSDNQVISVIQVIKLNRHPRFNFLVSSEKEIIGRVRLLKVDDTLSFGRIITERESGAIQVNAKVAGIDSVSYPDIDTWSEAPSEVDSLLERADAKVSFGEKPSEWLPKKNPTFGAISAHLGLGRYSGNVKSGSDDFNTKSEPIYPFISLQGELWMTPAWSLHTSLRQGIITTDNPQGSGDLSHSLSSYELMLGYNIRLGPGVWSPKIELFGGYSTYRLYIDKTTANSFTTKTYEGLRFGVSGYYPLENSSQYSLGADLFFFLDPKLREAPSSSGRSKSDIKKFGLFVDKRLQVNLKARVGLDFELYSSDFSGGTTESSSQRHTTSSLGLEYLF